MDLSEAHYLTDNLISCEGNLYMKNKDKYRKITKRNWHHYLNEIGWSKFPRKWISFLNKISETHEKNSLFALLQCPQDGDCLYHCIANAFNGYNRWLTYHSSKDIRNEIAESIGEDEFQTLISFYRAMKDADDYDNEWDPYDVRDITQFRKLIKKSGHSYWGDSLLMQIIASHYDINLMIYHSPDDETIQCYKMLSQYDESKKTICLWFEENHFQLIGYYNGDHMSCMFLEGQLPQELVSISN